MFVVLTLSWSPTFASKERAKAAAKPDKSRSYNEDAWEIRDDERQQPQSALAHEPPGSPGSSSMADGVALYQCGAASRVYVYKVPPARFAGAKP